MREFIGQTLVILGLIASVAVGIWIGWKGTWLSVATLTLICLVLTMYVTRLEQNGTEHTEWWEISEVFAIYASFCAWVAAVVIEPVYSLIHGGVIRIGIHQFVR